MSSNGSEDEPLTGEQAFARLSSVVGDTVAEIDRLRGELARAESQTVELEQLLRGVTSGERSPREMVQRLQHLEEENTDLRKRLSAGRGSVDRLLARIEFLEAQR